MSPRRDYSRGHQACDASPEVQALLSRLIDDNGATLAADKIAREEPSPENVAAANAARARRDATSGEFKRVNALVFDAAMSLQRSDPT